MGKKIDILKAKKVSLLKTMLDPSNDQKSLSKLKQKHENLSKICKWFLRTVIISVELQY